MKKRQVLYSLSACCLALLTVSFWYCQTIVDRNDGHFHYILDDAYIHMAMAKNLAEHGVWGISPYGFSSSSSSPLWTTLLALGQKLGLNPDFTPLIFNLLCALLIYIGLFFRLQKEGFGHWPALGLSLLAFWLAPGLYLVFTGLEHGLHVWFSLVYLGLAVSFVEKPCRRTRCLLLGSTMLLPMVRYEGLFLIAGLILLLLLERRIRDGLSVLAASLTLVSTYGVVSLSQGWYFLPSSVFLKGNRVDSLPSLFNFFTKGLEQMRANTHLLIAVLLLLLMALMLWDRFSRRERAALFLFLSAYLAQMFFARSGNFTNNPYLVRYDAYLTLLAIYLLFTLGRRLPRFSLRSMELLQGAAAVLLLIAAFSPFFTRALRMSAVIPAAASDLYRQQVQTARFLARHYPGEAVALNDIGCPAYQSPLHISDLLALIDKEMGDLILTNRYSPKSVDELLRRRNVQVIAVFDTVFAMVTGRGRPPASWIKVASWYIPDNRMSAHPVVSFYALDPARAERLRRAQAAFIPELPAGVQTRLDGAAPQPQ